MEQKNIIEGYELFVSQLDDAIASNPNLCKIGLNGKIILKGAISIIDKDGKHWEDYVIEIHNSQEFPNQFPLLFETSGKIPRIGDWHVYEDRGSCCVKIFPEEILRCKKGITVSEYIQEEVIPYLFNQTHRRTEGYYVNGEYSHGTKGIYEYYSEILKTGNNVKQTLELMKFVVTHERPYRTSMCFCGEKIKFRHCHRDSFDLLKMLGDNVIEYHYHEIARNIALL
jgi:hypothetical protein